MLDVAAVSGCLQQLVGDIVAKPVPSSLLAHLENPEALANLHIARFLASLTRAGVQPSELRSHVRREPYLHLKGVFSTGDCGETPLVWTPVPDGQGTLQARLAVVLMNHVCGMETVSYGSENGGALFVNLVTLDGAGRLAEKSRASMRGHTDAASFPFRGTADPIDPRIAPSPDVVYLAAVRNEERVPTVVVSLSQVLAKLHPEETRVLLGQNMVIRAQGSFQIGTQEILGDVHVVDGTNVLYHSEEGLWARYTHAQTIVYEEASVRNDEASSAKKNFEAACLACRQDVALEAGDLLLVNNRRALHGRAPVGTSIGGQSRWLLRSYGLDTTGLSFTRRYASPGYMLFP